MVLIPNPPLASDSLVAEWPVGREARLRWCATFIAAPAGVDPDCMADLPDPADAEERTERARDRAAAAAERLTHAERRLAEAREELADSTNEREAEAHRREIKTHERAIEFHRQAIHDQTEAAQLMEGHRALDQKAQDAGSMSAIIDENKELLANEADHQRRMMQHAEREQVLIAEAEADVRERSD
jgi:hypothetical protein